VNLLNIGAFAAATGLSIAALRHYDEIGLLEPARVDPDTGYRRYSDAQLDRARLICGLRAVDLPIDEIRAVLDRSSAEIRAALDVHRERLAAQVRELSQRIRAVDEFIAKGTTMPAVQAVRPVQLRIGVDDVAKAAAFYTAAFDAVFQEEIDSVRFGAYRSERFFLITMEEGAGRARFGLLVDDLDTAHQRALAAGGTEVHPPQEFSYKPRSSCVRDPSGNVVHLTQG
jgi:DNA-binding transcriptional MerR regulator